MKPWVLILPTLIVHGQANDSAVSDYASLVTRMLEYYHGACSIVRPSNTTVYCTERFRYGNLTAIDASNQTLEELLICERFTGFRRCRFYNVTHPDLDLQMVQDTEYPNTMSTNYTKVVGRLLQQFDGACNIERQGFDTNVTCNATSVSVQVKANHTVEQTLEELQVCRKSKNGTQCDAYNFTTQNVDVIMEDAFGVDYAALYSALLIDYYTGECAVSTTNNQTLVNCTSLSSRAYLTANGRNNPKPVRLEICKEQGAKTTCSDYEFAFMLVDDLENLAFLPSGRSSLPLYYQSVVENMTEYFSGACIQTQGPVRIILTCVNTRIRATLSSQPDLGSTIPIPRRLRICPVTGGGCGEPFLFTSDEESFQTALDAARP